jgi:hypothetical protein
MKRITVIAALYFASCALYNNAQDTCELEVSGQVTGSIGANTVSAYGCKQIWHNGAWHDSFLKNGKHGYKENGKFIVPSPSEMATSEAKKKQFQKEYNEATSEAKRTELAKQYNIIK